MGGCSGTNGETTRQKTCFFTGSDDVKSRAFGSKILDANEKHVNLGKMQQFDPCLSECELDSRLSLGFCASLLAAFLICCGSTFAQNKHCPAWTPLWARLWAGMAPVLGFLASLGCVVYIRVASSSPRSWYIHAAGIYFFCCAGASTSVALMIWAGCSWYKSVEVVALAGMLVFHMAGYGILQLMLVLKVEMLGETNSAARLWFRVSWLVLFAWMACFVLRIAEACAYCTHTIETIIGCFFICCFLKFTAVCVRVMLECSQIILRTASKIDEMENEAERTLAFHAVAAAFANATTAVQFGVAVLSQVPGVEVSVSFVIVQGVDVVFNLGCVLIISGLANVATRTPLFEVLHPSLHDTAPLVARNKQTDVLGQFAAAGRSARTAATYGAFGEPLAALKSAP